ncbi:guanine-N2--methyltransferase [Scheffersomyces coipomensis]|uniref:guanine-N2--methyltransferase n=1 Tax=Scheffersomyces coipomensis TaxID=1788519 RepID=UPI00315D0326
MSNGTVLSKIDEIKVDDYDIIKEGKAQILTPKKDQVFYNPIQQFNRDLSLMSIKAFIQLRQAQHDESQDEKSSPQKKIKKLNKVKILEALSATGLRAIRYAKELDGDYDLIVANDLLPEAVKSIDRNIQYNEVTKIKSNLGDAIKYMAHADIKFNIIDLDPYGTAAPFIDSAIQSIEDGGMLLVTCTDAGVLAGSGYPEKCFALYGGNNFGNSFINNETNHEVGIRLILGMIGNIAAKYKKSIEPMLSLSIDFYFRLFIKVKTSPLEVKQLSSKTMISYGCNGCGHKVNQYFGKIKDGKKFQYPKSVGPGSQCEYCQHDYNIAGPMYGSKLHSEEFIEKILEINNNSDKAIYGTTERVKGMLTLAKQELDEYNPPFYFNLNHLSSLFKSPPISIDQFVKAIGNLNHIGKSGYQVSLTHAKKNCVKTDTPWDIILRINIEWLKLSNQIIYKELKSKESLTEKETIKLQKLTEDIFYNGNLSETSIGYKIIQYFNQHKDQYEFKIDFETENELSQSIAKLRKVKMVRYQENPTKNWGPKSRPSSK